MDGHDKLIVSVLPPTLADPPAGDRMGCLQYCLRFRSRTLAHGQRRIIA
jgi:hypothetical protein